MVFISLLQGIVLGNLFPVISILMYLPALLYIFYINMINYVIKYYIIRNYSQPRKEQLNQLEPFSLFFCYNFFKISSSMVSPINLDVLKLQDKLLKSRNRIQRESECIYRRDFLQ